LPLQTFYEEEPRPQLSQGDICLAPAAMIWSAATLAPPPVIPPAPTDVGETVFVRGWQRGRATPDLIPDITLATSFSPVLVVSHDCEIDREWNDWVEMRVADGQSEDEARAEADARHDLDARIVVAPLLPYAAHVLREQSWDAVRRAQKIGYFPLAPMPALGGAEYLVHLSRLCAIERRLLHRDVRVLSLTDEARQLLRYKVAEAISSRHLSVLSKLESAVGHCIEDVHVMKQKRADVTAALLLDDGSEVQIGVRADPGPEASAQRLPDRS
jgi:hypothetical protein